MLIPNKERKYCVDHKKIEYRDKKAKPQFRITETNYLFSRSVYKHYTKRTDLQLTQILPNSTVIARVQTVQPKKKQIKLLKLISFLKPNP